MYIILVLTTSPLALIVDNQISFVNMMKDNKDQMYSKQKTRLDRVKMLFYVRVE